MYDRYNVFYYNNYNNSNNSNNKKRQWKILLRPCGFSSDDDPIVTDRTASDTNMDNPLLFQYPFASALVSLYKNDKTVFLEIGLMIVLFNFC